jgi:hypothetical protein
LNVSLQAEAKAKGRKRLKNLVKTLASDLACKRMMTKIKGYNIILIME